MDTQQKFSPNYYPKKLILRSSRSPPRAGLELIQQVFRGDDAEDFFDTGLASCDGEQGALPHGHHALLHGLAGDVARGLSLGNHGTLLLGDFQDFINRASAGVTLRVTFLATGRRVEFVALAIAEVLAYVVESLRGAAHVEGLSTVGTESAHESL